MWTLDDDLPHRLTANQARIYLVMNVGKIVLKGLQPSAFMKGSHAFAVLTRGA